MNERGMLIVLSGPSGSGKGHHHQEPVETAGRHRPVRFGDHPPASAGEVEGVHYFFRTREEFERMIEDNALLEWAEYNGNYYGTPEDAIREWLGQGKNVLLEIEVQGAEQVMNHRSDLVSIFITIPSMEELERRLRDRGTETEDKIQGRMAVAQRELTRAFRYDYVVLNDEVDLAVKRIHTIIDAEKMRYSRMETLVMEVLGHA